MRGSNEKGTTVNRIQRRIRSLSVRIGLAVSGRAFAGVVGSRARGRAVKAVFVLAGLVGVLLLTGAVGDAPASTTCLAPRFEPENQEVSVHATRAFIKEVTGGASGCSTSCPRAC